MALVNIDNCVSKVLQQLGKLEAGQGVEILSYKRNRGVSVLIRPDDFFYIREHGYIDEEKTLPLAELAKELKTIVKREFPRSRKIRIYQLDGPEDLNQPRKKL